MLNTKGKTVTLTKDQPGATYDPVSGTYVGGMSSSSTVKAYMASNVLKEDQSSVRGSRMVLLAATDTSGNPVPVPQVGDSIEGFRDTVKVVDLQEITEGEITACYICGVNE